MTLFLSFFSRESRPQVFYSRVYLYIYTYWYICMYICLPELDRFPFDPIVHSRDCCVVWWQILWWRISLMSISIQTLNPQRIDRAIVHIFMVPWRRSGSYFVFWCELDFKNKTKERMASFVFYLRSYVYIQEQMSSDVNVHLDIDTHTCIFTYTYINVYDD